MKSTSISDFVAQAMADNLKSEAYASLFGTVKTASDENDAKKSKKEKESKDSGSCGDSMYADDNDAKKKKQKKEESSSSSSDFSSADDGSSDSSDSYDSSDVDDNNHVEFESEDHDEFSEAYALLADKFPEAAAYLKLHHSADSGDDFSHEKFPHADSVLNLGADAALDVAIDSLLTASAALDNAGMEKTATLSLKLATLVVEAKKKDSKDKEKAAKEKAKAKEKAAKEKAKKDEQSAKDKAAKEKAKEKEKAAKEKEKAAKEKAKEKASKK